MSPLSPHFLHPDKIKSY
uniref:Uncharacterized protein n=1 Tax=Anguilla anguilla TaxID=7936 RepID=A0A0E9RFY6_ANGAN